MLDLAATGKSIPFYQMQYMVKKFYVYNTAHGNMK